MDTLTRRHYAQDPTKLHHEYNILSLSDLLEAREKHHIELMRKTNVVGTAVGLYLIRRSDPWPPKTAPRNRGPRNLANSEVRPYSWPCILVFVEKWEDDKNLPSDQQIANSLYLDDDRTVPVCVVEAPPVLLDPPDPRPVLFSPNRIGGGYPLVARVQERDHIASIGCLMTDGHTTYALTNRHVTGEPGEIVYTKAGSEMVRIGVASKKQLTRKPFSDVYKNFNCKKTLLHLDVGLVRIDDVNRWTAQIYGIGAIGDVAQIGGGTISLRVIDTPVIAYGCASGLMRGAIKALFYRYAASPDDDYVCDFLIGARDAKTPFTTHRGDSGTVWLLDIPGTSAREPIAVQWGGQLFAAAGGIQQSCALATSLTTVCNLLDVDVIRDWNIGGPDYWGETGHYTIGALACSMAFDGLPKLQNLLSNNMDRIGFRPADLKQNEKVLRNKAHYDFVPLADVADDVWRNTRKSDENNHFADMDEVAPSGPFKGKTLLDITNNQTNIDPQVWLDFYSTLPRTNPGALPFRIWQIYDEMVNFARKGDALQFLAAAGCLAHYSGDACQPLHVSRLHHGIPPVKKGTVAYQVHSVYETLMLNQHAAEIVDGISAIVTNATVKPTFSGGHGAAQRVVDLMRATFKKIPPRSLVDVYNKGKTPADRLQRLWEGFGQTTIQVMADGCLCLADIWASAWKEGGGEQTVSSSELGPADVHGLADLYNDSSFLPSVGLKELVKILNTGLAAHSAPVDAMPDSPRKPRKRVVAKKKKKRVAKKKR